MNFTIIRRALAIFVGFISTSAFCFGDVSLFIESHWNIFSNAPCFQTSYSTTNLPPEVLRSMIAHGRDGQTLTTNHFGLVWAATDGTNYIVHFEYTFAFDSTFQDMQSWGAPHYEITAAIRKTGSTNFIISTGPCWQPLDNYKQFIYYENVEAGNKLWNELYD